MVEWALPPGHRGDDLRPRRRIAAAEDGGFIKTDLPQTVPTRSAPASSTGTVTANRLGRLTSSASMRATTSYLH